MVERYHLVLAAWALAAGCVVATADRWGPSFVRAHTVGAAGLIAAVLGGALGGSGNTRWWPWLVAAALVALWPDRGVPAHPLGPWVLPAAVVSLVGVWSAVPDTEPPLAAGAVLAPLALLRWSGRRSSGPPATVAAVVLVAGSVWVGSAGWGAALCTVVAVGMVAVAPAVAGFGPRRFPAQWLTVVLGAHAAVALVVPRLIMRRPVPVAVAIALVVTAALAVLAGVARAAGRRVEAGSQS